MKNKRIISWLLLLALAFAFPASAFADEAQKDADSDVEQSYTQTVYIRSAQDLLDLAENCKLDTWSVGKRVVLKNDISLSETDFELIPSFAGLFDGNGHTVSGLLIDGSLTPAGLFGELRPTGIIKSLTVSGTVMPTGDAQFVGGIVGESYGLIINCTFTGNVIGSGDTGGIAGLNGLSGRISDCEVSGAVLGSDMTGGIVGCNWGLTANCINKACVNTVSVDPTIGPSDINFDFLTDVSKLTTLDTRSAAMDTGGIAGYSAGILNNCVNKAAVGYPHIGYNVGGIVGRSCGYVFECGNAAEIYGRKDVGGIVGQMEPYIAKYLTESTVAQLQRQLDELDALVGETLQHADGVSGALTNRLNSIAASVGSAASAAGSIQTYGTILGTVDGSGVSGGSGSISGEVDGLFSGSIESTGSGWADGGLDAQTQISISTDLSGLSSALYGMAGQMSLLGGELSGASGQLKADAETIRAKVNEITQIGFDLILDNGENDGLIDSSEIDLELITLGKVADCDNTSAVNGDINVGGIAGCMAMEYSLDPEDDITVSIDNSTRKKYEVKAVVQQCRNTGAVQSKRNYVGGIAGKMDLGLIDRCEAYGSVISESGSYAGGIVGLCGSTVRNCFAKCSLSGEKFVGGIVARASARTKPETAVSSRAAAP